MKQKKTLFVTRAAMIAALYVVLTLLANMFGLANYPIQLRFSESLCILPFFMAEAVPGVFAGCIIANLMTGALPLDVIFGSLATLLGALGTRAFRRWKWTAPIFPIISNTIIVPLVLTYVYHFEGSLPYFMVTVGIGEVLSCGVLGMVLLVTLEKYKDALFKQ